MIYGKATNRLSELHKHLPLVGKEFNHTINSIASHANCYTTKDEINLTKDLLRLQSKLAYKIIFKQN